MGDSAALASGFIAIILVISGAVRVRETKKEK